MAACTVASVLQPHNASAGWAAPRWPAKPASPRHSHIGPSSTLAPPPVPDLLPICRGEYPTSTTNAYWFDNITPKGEEFWRTVRPRKAPAVRPPWFAPSWRSVENGVDRQHRCPSLS